MEVTCTVGVPQEVNVAVTLPVLFVTLSRLAAREPYSPFSINFY